MIQCLQCLLKVVFYLRYLKLKCSNECDPRKFNFFLVISNFPFQDENNRLKVEIKYLQDVLEGNITEIRKDITDLRIHQGRTDDDLQEAEQVLTGKIFQ